MKKRNLYVYGLVRTTDGFSPDGEGLMREPLSLIDLDGIAAIVSEASDDEIMATRRNMLTHTRILETAMEAGPVLPFRFGMVAAEERLRDVLIGERERALEQAFASLEGRTESGIRVSFAREAIMKRIVSDNSDLQRAYESLAGRDPNQTHYQRIELGREVHNHLSYRREQAGNALAELVSQHCDRIVVHAPADDMEVLHAAVLTTSEQSEALMSVLEEWDAADPDLFAIKVVSPVPPYNFVSLQLGNEASLAA